MADGTGKMTEPVFVKVGRDSRVDAVNEKAFVQQSKFAQACEGRTAP
jgi:hypothetical protein